MKKREKFLLAFLISFVIIIGRYVYTKTKEAIHEGGKDKAEYEWLFNDININGIMEYDELTEEAKNFFREQIEDDKKIEIELQKHCAENPEECASLKQEKESIYSKAMDYYINLTTHTNEYYSIATVYDTAIYKILILTLIIYFIISLELKSKKQYIKDSMKILLIISLFLIIGSSLLCFHEYILRYNSVYYLENTINYYLDYILFSFYMILPTFIIILISNLIINLIKRKNCNKK